MFPLKNLARKGLKKLFYMDAFNCPYQIYSSTLQVAWCMILFGFKRKLLITPLYALPGLLLGANMTIDESYYNSLTLFASIVLSRHTNLSQRRQVCEIWHE